MRELHYVIRFFHVVTPLPRLLVITFAVIAAVSMAAIALEPRNVARALGPVLLLQLLAASSGFAASARRGYYDLLLSRGHARGHIAMVHWLVSIAPGVASWIAVGVAELVVTRGASHLAFSSGTVVAMLAFSTIPWGITVALPRFSGAVGWLLIVLAIAALVPDQHAFMAFPERPSFQGVLTALFVPVVAVGRDLSPTDAVMIAPVVGVAAVVMVLGILWIHRTDVPLESAQ